MQKHVETFFPLEDMPEIFGLHRCATAAADSYMANDIMERVYKHQYIVKRTTNISELHESANKAAVIMFKFYHERLLKIMHMLPE